MVKLIVTDLDGTLLDEEKLVREEDRKTLMEAVRDGSQLCLASGRMQAELEQVMDVIGIPAHGVSQNGAFVRTREGEPLVKHVFTPDLAVALFEETQGEDLFMLVCLEHQLLSHRRVGMAELVESRLFSSVRLMPELGSALLRQEVMPCKFSYFGEMERIEKLKSRLERRFGEEVDLFISDRDCLDVMPRGISKGRGLQVLVERLGISREQVLTIGDAFNDVSMFESFPHLSFAMAHAPAGVRLKAGKTADSVSDAVKRAMTRV
ncbi:HAD family hydrolase [Desmospora profundinema]|uniref:Cof subfamily protein (Haloacid dehalogenase superfamily) n=1 Tax=Desmospora profundinema TaxID=1571184 RepID=A0ABU1IK17_9BACL|nr:HAD family hydrolase [Desmospora profundinema]MDR6225125.1 Cof subfamily protein (haloacid dehalogenase superfamily) [Desmospora profundinema]